MMANKLQFGMMGDYPLVVNGFTFQNNPESKSRLIAVAAYNRFGSGNGLVVHKDSPYFELSDLKGKLVSVPFGSAAHGMVLKAMQDRGWPADYFQLVSQSPEVGSTNLQEKKIDAHADFVPFAELLPFRGFARKIFDGVETNLPTWHGVVVRTDFAEKYPEVVVAYIKALIAANEWFRADPKLASEKIQEWTGINKEVVYIFLGPGGNMTTDPTIKPFLIDAAAQDVKVLQNLGRMKEFDVTKWVDDSYVRKAFAELKLDYDTQLASTANYEVKGEDKFCNQPIVEPRQAGEVWVDGEGIEPFSSAACTLAAYSSLKAKGKKINVAYVFDSARGIKLFADQAYYAIGGDKTRDFPLPAQEGCRGLRSEVRRQGLELRGCAQSRAQRRLTHGRRRPQADRDSGARSRDGDRAACAPFRAATHAGAAYDRPGPALARAAPRRVACAGHRRDIARPVSAGLASAHEIPGDGARPLRQRALARDGARQPDARNA